MKKSFRFLFLIAVLVSSLVTGPVTPVHAASLPAEVNKTFTPLQIDAGGYSVLRVTIYNPNTFPLTNAQWTDNLEAIQPGLFIDDPADVVIDSNCGVGATVTAVPGTTTLSLSGATVPAQSGATPGSCYIEVRISSITPGSLINYIPAGALTADGNDGGTPVVITNTSPATSTITIIAVSPPSLSKTFTPPTIFVGQTSQLEIRINNNDVDTNLTGATYTDYLPAGLEIANPSGLTLTNCGAGATVTNGSGGALGPGDTSLRLNNGTITPSQDCIVRVNVTGASGPYTIANGNPNQIPAGPGGLGSLQTDQGVTNGTPAQAELTIQPVGIQKAFAPGAIDAGDTSILTITLQNPTGSAYTGVGITDNLTTMGAGFTVAGAPTLNTCGDGVTTGVITAPIGGTSIALSNATIPPSATPPTPVGTCQISIPVQAALTLGSTTRTNTIPAGAMTGPVTNYSAATANLTVNSALYGTKAYSPTNILVGGTSTVTITLNNRSSTPLTSVTFTDTMAANVAISGTPASPQCGGTITSVAGPPGSITLTNGTIPANGNCTIVFNVTSSVAGTYDNTVGANTIMNDQGVRHAAFSTNPDLVVAPTGGPVGLTKSFQTNPLQIGNTSRLRITITAPADTGITGVNVTDTLPAGLVIAASPAPTNGCGGTLTAVAGTNVISLSGGSRAAGQSCNIDVYVTSNTPGDYTNTIPAGAIVTDQGRTNATAANANLRVSSITTSKAFYPTTVQAGGRSTMTITIYNYSSEALTNLTLTDTLPGTTTNGLVIASYPPSPAPASSCGGTLTATAGAQTIQLTGATMPAGSPGNPGLCTIVLDVEGRDSSPASPSSYQNQIPVNNVSATLPSTGGTVRPMAQANATLNIQNLAFDITKGFMPDLVYGGATSTMTVGLINPNTAATLTGISFTDNMDLLYLPGASGIKLANPVDFDTGTCGGVLTGNPGDSSFSFSGGVLAPGASCQLTLKVIMEVNGNRINQIPAGAVTTMNGVSNPLPVQASLTNLPGVSVHKSFSPAAVLTNEPSTLTITIRNTSNISVVNMGLSDNLPGTLPDGLQVADPANAANTCGGALTAVPGAQSIQLSGGGLAPLGSPGDTCTITVEVVSTRPGVYVNTIPAGALTADGGITNNDPTSDTLTVNAGVFSLGNRVWYDTDNSGDINGSEVGADGVTVQLYAADAGGNPSGAPLATQTTANGGYYRFDNLAAGDYVVVIPSNQFDGGPLTGYWSSGTTLSGAGAISETAAPDADNNADSDDNGTRQTSGAFNGAVISSAITLGPSANEPTNDTDANPTNPPGEAPDAQSNRTVDFGFYRLQLGNLVFQDANNNGVYDAGDAPIAGATVQLFASDGVTEIPVGPDGILGTADDAPGGVTTGAGGTYQFNGLPAGGYIVRVTPPGGYLSAIDTFDAADTSNPNANTDNNDNGVGTGGGTVSSNVVTLTPGSAGAQSNNTVSNATGTTYNPTLDFGFTPLPFSLGNRVWFDTDNSGDINGSEVGADGITVQLYAADAGGNPSGAPLAAQTTANGGYYRFDNLAAGDYVVVIPSNQFDGGPLTGYWSSGTTLSGAGAISETAAPDADNNADSDDNGTRQTSGAFNGAVISSAITLGPSANEPTNDTDANPTNPPGEAPDAQSNRTVDFGFYRLQLGNLVFQDVNTNGVYDAGDAPIAGATVQLFASDGVTEIPVGPDGILGTADDAPGGVTTGAGGTYLFSGLPEGSYIVRVPSSSSASTIDTFDAADTSNPNTNTDNNDNGVGTGGGTVSSNVVALTPGSAGAQSNNTVSNATGTTYNPTVDFGFSQLLFSLGNRVWYDTDNSGDINGSEVGADGVTVQLYAADAGGNPSGAPLATQTTANGGYYRFDNLAAGDYVVVIPASQFDGGPLTGYWSSGTTINGNGAISETAAPPANNDVDSDDNGTRQTSGTFSGAVMSRVVTLGPTANEPINDTDAPTPNPAGESPNSQSNRTVDFGFYRLQLGNQVYQDINENGTYDAGDLPLAGASVQLFASNGATEIPVGPDGILGTADDAPGGVTTGAGGTYLFSGLPEGSYIVRVLPTGYASTIDTADAADTSNPNTNTDNNDNGVGTGGGAVSSNIVTLTPGSAGAQSNNTVSNATGTTYNPTVDFGYVTSLSKQIVPPDDATHTVPPNVTIGEIITYEVAMVIPNGGLTNVQLVDIPQSGLAFVDCVSITLPAGVTSTRFTGGACDALDGIDPATSNPLIQNNGGRITFDFGDVGNTSGSSQTVLVRYSLIVLDILANGNGDSLTNSVTWSWTGGSRSASAPVVEIVEPIMNITKDAVPTTAAIGDVITFTINVSHAAISTADAFDVIVYDYIPAGLTFNPASLVVGGTAALTSSSYDPLTNTLQFNWDVFRLGETASITFQAIFVGPAPVVNNSRVEWTSHEIDPTLPGPPPVPEQRSPYNPASTERWYDPSAPAGVNSYGASASVTINSPSGAQAELPETGFAPGRVTVLPEQPLDYKYAQYGNLWLEIPKLGVKASIVGVPRTESGWDVKWLWEQAGWLQGTSFPTWEGNSVITGHVTLPNGQKGPFAELAKLRWGDQVIVHAYGQRYIYEVRINRVIRPNAISPFQHEEKSWVTLLTCVGYNESTNTYRQRLETRAVLIKVENE